jgi:hypothetical protein
MTCRPAQQVANEDFTRARTDGSVCERWPKTAVVKALTHSANVARGRALSR